MLVYRITSTIHFLAFFFITLLTFDDFRMSDRLVILIAVLNDAATLVISVDRAEVSPKPDKWRLGQLLFVSCVLSFFLTGFSFITLFVAKYFNMTTDQIGTILYLQISSCPHFVIFTTRVQGHFWVNIPSLTFFTAILGTQLIAMLISIFGVDVLGAAPM